MKRTKDAFFWIVKFFRKNKIKFRITGGFAARIYGSKRKLADIDLGIHNKYIEKVSFLLKRYVIFGPKRYKSEDFNLLLVSLKYKGQKIDISGVDDDKLFDRRLRRWEMESSRLDFVRKKVYNLIVPVVKLKDLIDYKMKIARKVDKIDVKQIISSFVFA